jgi:hypothetical protein
MKNLFHNVYDVAEQDGRYRPVRFTDRQLASLYEINPMFKQFGRCAAGVSLVFDTDAEEISFSYQYTILYTRIGGFDVYENGQLFCNRPLPAESCEGVFRYRKESEGTTRIEIYLPSNAEMTVWDFNFGAYTPVAEPQGKLILYYGDSMTQSAYTGTPSLSFATLAARRTSSRFINRGVGSLFYDERALDENDTVQPDIVFSQFAGNDLIKHKNGEVVFVDGKVQYNDMDALPELMDNAKAYLKKLQRIYPDAKIYVISRIWRALELSPQRIEVEKAYIAETKKLAHELGLNYIEGDTLGAHIRECHAQDEIHFTALGGAMVADSLVKYINS